MANDRLNVPRTDDWILANPWPWLGAGFACVAWSWLWTVVFGEAASDYRIIVLAFGLLVGGVGAWLRWSDCESVYLVLSSGPLFRLGLGCLFGAIAIGTTGLFLFSFFGRAMGLHIGSAFLVFITSAPLCFFACRRCFQADSIERGPREIVEETAVALVTLAALCLLGSYTLYLGPRLATDWDTMRLVMRVFTAVCLYGAALVLVATAVRRLVISLLFMIHFLGIATACMSAHPSPWIAQQAWTRLFRPYLEFMYLVNAYHFYAPEPGPYSYLWFRVIYTNPDDKQDYGFWYKVPHIAADGRLKHSVALEYQRFLALTESLAALDATPAPFRANGEPEPLFARRLKLLPSRGLVVGDPDVQALRIPLHPRMSQVAQVQIPSFESRQLLKSYARFVARKFARHPEEKAWDFKSVKVYRAIHVVPSMDVLLSGYPPDDPQLYHPYYLGNFDREGEMIVDHDPYLYWLLPILRKNGLDPESEVRDYCRMHAGDPRWIRPAGMREWVETPLPRHGD